MRSGASFRSALTTSSARTIRIVRSALVCRRPSTLLAGACGCRGSALKRDGERCQRNQGHEEPRVSARTQPNSCSMSRLRARRARQIHETLPLHKRFEEKDARA